MAAEVGEFVRSGATGLKLSDALFRRSRSGFCSFAAISSNVKAIEAALMFANGLAPFVALVGPSGWGKTHLIDGAAGLIRRECGLQPVVHTAAQWASAGARWDHQTPLILDDCQEALPRNRVRQALRFGLERRVQAGRPTLLAFTAPKATRTIRALLPGGREWQIAQISAPSVTERELVSRHMAGLEGLVLSNAIYRFIARQTNWDGNAMLGTLRRLKLLQNRWVDTDEVLQALGILNPYLIDSPGSDLRDQVHETVCRTLDSQGITEDRANLAVDLSVYLMIDRMGLSEGDVASYFRLSPGEAYCRAQRIARIDTGSCVKLKADCGRAIVASLD